MSNSKGPRSPRVRRVDLVIKNSPSASPIHWRTSGDRLPSLGTRLLKDGGHGRSRVITPQRIPSCPMKVSTKVFPQLFEYQQFYQQRKLKTPLIGPTGPDVHGPLRVPTLSKP